MPLYSLCIILLRKYPHWWTPTKKKNNFTNLQWSQKQRISPFSSHESKTKQNSELQQNKTKSNNIPPGGSSSTSRGTFQVVSQHPRTTTSHSRGCQRILQLHKKFPPGEWKHMSMCIPKMRTFCTLSWSSPPLSFWGTQRWSLLTPNNAFKTSKHSFRTSSNLKGLQQLLHAISLVQVAWDMVRIYLGARPYPPPPTASRNRPPTARQK